VFKGNIDCLVLASVALSPFGNALPGNYPGSLFGNFNDSAVIIIHIEGLNYKVGSASLKHV